MAPMPAPLGPNPQGMSSGSIASAGPVWLPSTGCLTWPHGRLADQVPACGRRAPCTWAKNWYIASLASGPRGSV
jgi:hypothetical protein